MLLAAGGRLLLGSLTRAGVTRPVRHAALGALALLALWSIVVVQPAPAVATGDFPAELLWEFRLGALATQLALHGGVAVVFGLLTARRERSGTAVLASSA